MTTVTRWLIEIHYRPTRSGRAKTESRIAEASTHAERHEQVKELEAEIEKEYPKAEVLYSHLTPLRDAH